MIQIQFLNLSTALSQSDAAAIVKAVAVQVTRDFYPLWGINAHLYLAPSGQQTPTPGYWTIGFFDNADQAGALGYHDLTADGLPLGKVFVKTTLDAGDLVSVTASHETLEMLADPDINRAAEFDDPQGAPAKFYAYEVCDACEDDSLGYQINGITVSDFVTPAYFEQFQTATKFDLEKHISAPFQILPGGYMGVLDLANLGQGWQQVTARRSALEQAVLSSVSFLDLKAVRNRRAAIGSRRERRRTPRHMWLRSTYQS